MICLTMKEAASRLGVSETTFWRMRKDFALPTIRLHKRELVELETLESWLRSPERISASADSK